MATYHNIPKPQPQPQRPELQPGEERYERILWRNRRLIAYDYRHTDGRYFHTAAYSLKHCQLKRDWWLETGERC